MIPDGTALRVSAIVDCRDEVCQQRLAAILAELDSHGDLEEALAQLDLERHLVAACGDAGSDEERQTALLVIAAVEQALARAEDGGD